MLGWFKRLFFTRRRDVSRLRVDGEDAVTETVDTSGPPLKEGHLRRAWRDARLLPKPRVPRALRKKRKKCMTRDEADRLFGGTMRTRNRRLRDLAPDEEQLKRLRLPAWKTEDDLAGALGISLRELHFYAIHRERDRFANYVRFAIPKRSGGHRVIMAPKRRLKSIQRKLLGLLIETLPVSEHARGFRKGLGTPDNAAPHVGQAMVIRMDLKDFFPTVTFARVRGYFIAMGYGYPVATALACLTTEAERQPVVLEDGSMAHVPVTERHCVQGSPTSPGLCNAIVRRLDHRVAGLARKFGVNYTRYADDLTFSGPLDRRQAFALTQAVRRVIEAEGFVVNEGKTLIMSRARAQIVTGAVVNEAVDLPRRQRRQLRAMLHRLSTGQAAHDGSGHPLNEAQVRGRVAYQQMLNPGRAEDYSG